jgi:hypothetical protein
MRACTLTRFSPRNSRNVAVAKSDGVSCTGAFQRRQDQQ